MQNNWLDDVFFPAIYYRLQCLDFPIIRGFDEFKNHIMLRKIENFWFVEHHAYPIDTTCYAICFEERNLLHHFSISSDRSMTEKYISFYANAKKKLYANFAYEFSKATKKSNAIAYELFNSSETQHNVCYLHKLTLPNDAIEQIKNTVINRDNDEYLSFCSNVMLCPKETFEEVLIEKDLNC